MRVYDLPESIPVLPSHCLALEGDLQSLVRESESTNSDLWQTRSRKILVYCLLKRHQLLRGRQAKTTESLASRFVFNPLSRGANVSSDSRRGRSSSRLKENIDGILARFETGGVLMLHKIFA